MHPGTTEIQWLADLKPTAEEIAKEVLGYPVRWSVETTKGTGSKRSDVLVETDEGEVILSGEAKRPDDPLGAHPLVASEVEDAVGKAQRNGVQLCFTTNFHQTAVLDAGPGLINRPLRRLQGPLIDFIPRSIAGAPNWWDRLNTKERRAATEYGLRALFERYLSLTQGAEPSVPIEETALGFFADLTQALLEPLHRAFKDTSASENPGLRMRALTGGLDIADAQQARYLIAQGIAEVLTASLFHRLLRDHFADIGPLLGGTTPRKSSSLARLVIKSLREATRASGDYETILSLSAIGEWVVENASATALRSWLELLGFVEHIDLAEITSDILGSIFERLISPERRHDMGQHYTNPLLARAMSKWGVTSDGITVLDPACGAGTFLVETYGRHEALGLGHDEILKRTLGNDLDPFAVHLASINLVTRRIHKGLNYPRIRLGDAFDIGPGEEMLKVDAHDGMSAPFDKVDLVITNPPFGRKHPSESEAAAQLDKLGLLDRPHMAGANLAAWFVLLGVALTKDEGRMAFVLPSAVLQNENLGAWRAWVRTRYDLVIWHSEFDIWFSDARISTCVLLFNPRPEGPTETAAGQRPGSLCFANLMEPIGGGLSDLEGTPVAAESAQVRDLTNMPIAEDVLIAGTIPRELTQLLESTAIAELGELDGLTVEAGKKLGHSAFRLKDIDPESPAVLRTVEGLGTTLRLNRKYLTPILASPKQFQTGEVETSAEFLLTISKQRPRSSSLARYLALAENQGVHHSPSVRARGKSWWSIDSEAVDVAVPMNGQFRHEIAWCSTRMVANNNFNVIRCADREAAEIVAASLASAFGALSRLYISGEIGCEGARRVLLSQFVRWPVLDPSKVSKRLRERVLSSYRAWRRLISTELDEMPADDLVIWTELTRDVAYAAFGRVSEEARSLADAAVAQARSTVLRRRIRETKALSGRTRKGGSGGPTLIRRVSDWLNQLEDWDACLDLLTSGPEIVPLRAIAEINAPRLFGDSTSFDANPDSEKRLVELLGPRFRAAWPDPVTQAVDLAVLVSTLDSMLTAAPSALLGDKPPRDNAAWSGWDRLREEILRACSRVIQSEVNDLLM